MEVNVVPAAPISPRPKRWTATELHRAIGQDAFDSFRKLELIEGVLYEKMGQNEEHVTTLWWTQVALQAAFASDGVVVGGSNLHLDEYSEPEPDVLVLRTRPVRIPTPAEVVLLVEVSDTSLSFDLGRKAALYARHGIPEYWVVDVTNRLLYVHRLPDPATGTWQERRVLAHTLSVEVLPGKQLPIAELFPPVA
jgi:Uma2 family endonuclease